VPLARTHLLEPGVQDRQPQDHDGVRQDRELFSDESEESTEKDVWIQREHGLDRMNPARARRCLHGERHAPGFEKPRRLFGQDRVGRLNKPKTITRDPEAHIVGSIPRREARGASDDDIDSSRDVRGRRGQKAILTRASRMHKASTIDGAGAQQA